jgi:hypothetical protein
VPGVKSQRPLPTGGYRNTQQLRYARHIKPIVARASRHTQDDISNGQNLLHHPDDIFVQTTRPVLPETQEIYSPPAPFPWRIVRYAAIGMSLVWFLFFLSTAGASWWEMTFSYPHYGDMHGTSIMMTLKKDEQPSRIVSWNDHGTVELVILNEDNPTKAHIFVGPNLQNAGFPDGTHSVVDLATDSVQGEILVNVTSLSTFDGPFHATSSQYLFSNGNWKQLS